VYFDYLTSGIAIDPARVRSVRPTRDAEKRLRRAYGEAIRREYRDMPLSTRVSGEYTALRRQRRTDLEALLKNGINGDNAARAMDLIFAICEESVWQEEPDGGFDDDSHPGIDLMAAQTASLLAWALHDMQPELKCRMYILNRLRRRVFSPLIAHDDYCCFDKRYPFALAVLCEIMAAALLCEQDRTRLFSLLRRLAPAADRLIDDPEVQPLKQAMVNWTSATALYRLACTAAGPQAGARPLPLNRWLDTLLYTYQGGDRFLDPRGAGIVRGVNGADILFAGMTAGDEAVQALGTAMQEAETMEPSSPCARLMIDMGMEDIAVHKPIPRYRHAAVEDNSVMSARGAGAYATLVPSGRGGFCVCFDDEPAVYACKRRAVMINGRELNPAMCAGDGDFEDVRADMSVDLTPALPKNAGARFMQRTLMLDRSTGLLRMVDMVECDAPGEIVYAFDTPGTPKKEGGGARMGKGFIAWDPGAADEIRFSERIDSGDMYCLELRYHLEPGSNIFNFIIEHV